MADGVVEVTSKLKTVGLFTAYIGTAVVVGGCAGNQIRDAEGVAQQERQECRELMNEAVALTRPIQGLAGLAEMYYKMGLFDRAIEVRTHINTNFRLALKRIDAVEKNTYCQDFKVRDNEQIVTIPTYRRIVSRDREHNLDIAYSIRVNHMHPESF